MAARSTLVTLHNRTERPLTLVGWHLQSGQWSGGNSPPATVAAGGVMPVASVSRGFLTGTEGDFTYSIDADSLTFHWRNPFLGVNSYTQRAPGGYGLWFSGGRGHEAGVDLVLAPALKVSVPGFSPSRHGFHFPNAWPKGPNRRLVDLPEPFQDITIGDAANGMCGGMAYAAADYYLARELSPASTQPPGAPGDPLFDYVSDRLFKSFDLPTGPLVYWKYMSPTYPDTPRVDAGGRSWVIAHETFPTLAATIDAGTPCPLGLVMTKSLNPADLGKNHQVLAYAYLVDSGHATIWVYDPNSPERDDITIEFDLSDATQPIPISTNIDISGQMTCLFVTPYARRTPVGGRPDDEQPPPGPITA